MAVRSLARCLVVALVARANERANLPAEQWREAVDARESDEENNCKNGTIIQRAA